MIEFEEFLSIVRGGRQSKNETDNQGGTQAIYTFFKNLAVKKGKLKEKKKQIQEKLKQSLQEKSKGDQLPKGTVDDLPFQLFISMHRRRKILDALKLIGEKDNEKFKKGEIIMNNYRKSLVEKMARETVDDHEKQLN